ncbi:hypothetical protein GCL57_06975 [Fluviispira multicolorata]|uniref:Major facilitator superfamily (MFS) profile domain-containing protein n=1 Tax=Fluviispira multicolorata TaxID=2654512 RepID=A0A833N3T1_9BACT|nr:hypothetical protein GCL57_06975 [Fluviispira multicolorata]
MGLIHNIIYLNYISPKKYKATYFGIVEIKQAGFFLGPIIGGFIYDHFGRKTLFMSCTFLLALSAILYTKRFLLKKKLQNI